MTLCCKALHRKLHWNLLILYKHVALSTGAGIDIGIVIGIFFIIDDDINIVIHYLCLFLIIFLLHILTHQHISLYTIDVECSKLKPKPTIYVYITRVLLLDNAQHSIYMYISFQHSPNYTHIKILWKSTTLLTVVDT